MGTSEVTWTGSEALREEGTQGTEEMIRDKDK